jgi:hypothetical protein
MSLGAGLGDAAVAVVVGVLVTEVVGVDPGGHAVLSVVLEPGHRADGVGDGGEVAGLAMPV